MRLLDLSEVARAEAGLPVAQTEAQRMTLFKLSRGARDGFLPGLRPALGEQVRGLFEGTPMYCLGANEAAAVALPVSTILAADGLRDHPHIDYDPARFVEAQQKGCVVQRFTQMTRRWDDLRAAGNDDSESAVMLLDVEPRPPPPAEEMFPDHRSFRLGSARLELHANLDFLPFKSRPHPWEVDAGPE